MAFLVDGDSAPANLAGELLAETAKFGPAVVRRVYGDWGSSNMNTWRSVSRDLALVAVHHTSNISGKNSTDISLVIDAVDLYHQGVVRGFCLVTSDSDFTQLATYLRERGMFVMAIGRKQTPSALKQACDVFVLTENLKPAKSARGERRPAPDPPPRRAATRPKARPAANPARQRAAAPAVKARRTVTDRAQLPLDDALPLLRKAFDMTVTDEGIAHMSHFGSTLRRLDSSFDARSYGKRQFIDLIRAFPKEFEVDHPKGEGAGVVVVRRVRR